ncbi:CRISPR-associated endonuclease Cas1 [Pontibacter sp. G13]|uniref:CRISPR-associated endonuclease Cas1 n=1 Tax=Pontibacter sp. G13 TaxID=3074898 RepID=UPI00288A0295|nr:CRISPR-associated endonuclease Cas1 [Pontibacter sp. G13]WNJ18153.1 CRISPR-associated endonuclease Cas1 [Pontibacter sp. G13]
MDLFINTPGTYLHVREAMFEVRKKVEGQVERHQFAAQKVSRILMSRGAALSTDAIELAMKYHVDILFVKSDGFPHSRIWHAKLGSTTKIRKLQLKASLGQEGLEAIQTWLGKKLENQQAFLVDLGKHRKTLQDDLKEAAEKIASLQFKITASQADSCDGLSDTLRGWEGTAGRLYFQMLGKAIPARYTFHGRSSRPAKDPFNAFLNYAYGMLYGLVEKSLIIAGIDPYVGYLHRDDYNHKSMVWSVYLFVDSQLTHK